MARYGVTPPTSPPWAGWQDLRELGSSGPPLRGRFGRRGASALPKAPPRVLDGPVGTARLSADYDGSSTQRIAHMFEALVGGRGRWIVLVAGLALLTRFALLTANAWPGGGDAPVYLGIAHSI